MAMQKSKETPRTPETRRATSTENTSTYMQDPCALTNPSQQRSFQLSSDSPEQNSLAEANGFNGISEDQREDGHHHLPSSPPKAPKDSADIVTPASSSAPMFTDTRLGLSDAELDLLDSASELPPVTKQSLKELDLNCIMKKLALRVDVNYDRDLHFTPARHGKDNPRKKAADNYWEALAVELRGLALRSADVMETGSRPRRFRSRLAGLFDTIREILQTLVPTRDHSAIAQQLDTDLLLQQAKHKVLDMVGLARWLAALLKMHCAPMRDGDADKMAKEIESGYLNSDMRAVTGGLKSLFGLLETMKLDVANHQIRTFRFLLIDNSVNWLQRRYVIMIKSGEKKTKTAALWFEKLQKQADLVRLCAMDDGNQDLSNLALVCHGVSESLLSFRAIQLPATFDDERGRLRMLRSDLQDLIYLDICCYILSVLLNGERQTPQTYHVLKTRLWYILEEDEEDETVDGENRWIRNMEPIALEIARAKSMIAPETGPLCPSAIDTVEIHVQRHFTQFTQVFKVFSTNLFRNLQQETLTVAKRYLQMTPLEISESQRGPASEQREPGTPPYADVQSIAKRLAHVGVLHWWIWGPLVYQRDSTEDWDKALSPEGSQDGDIRMEG